MANMIYSPSQQNYYFRKGVAFTEDHIVVKKLFLYNVPAKLTEQEVQAYFELFGSVQKIQLFSARRAGGGGNDGKRRKIREGRERKKTGYVHFANPRDACEALRHREHIIEPGGHRVSVKVNDSWHQPDAYGESREADEPSGSKQELSAGNILMLDDYCLEHIMRMLSVLDRIHFARTCSRFRSVYQEASPALNRSINFDVFDGMTVWDMRDFFKLSGKDLQHIEGIIPPGRCQRICQFFGSHCINVKTMNVTFTKLSVHNIRKLFAKLDKLEDLTLHSCALSNTSLLALKHLLQLKRLNLSDNEQLTGVNMNFLPESIECLNLSGCTALRSHFLTRICKALPRLRVLDLMATFTSTAFQQLVSSRCCPALEELVISCVSAAEYEYVAKLPRLKKLVLNSYEQWILLRPELLNWLVEHKAHQLEHFEARGRNSINAEILLQINQLRALRILMLPHNNNLGDSELEALKLQHLEVINLRYWPNLTNAGVLQLLLSCPKLNELHLEQCKELTEKLLHDIISKLRLQIRDKENLRQLPIKLHVFGSRIKELSLQHSDIAAKDIIDVSLAPHTASDLYVARISTILEVAFLSDENDSFGSDDELVEFYDHYLHDEGFLVERLEDQFN